jgi:hypothetical protein
MHGFLVLVEKGIASYQLCVLLKITVAYYYGGNFLREYILGPHAWLNNGVIVLSLFARNLLNNKCRGT